MTALPPAGRNRTVLIVGVVGRTCMAKILLAEDDDSLRGFLVAALRRAGEELEDRLEGVFEGAQA